MCGFLVCFDYSKTRSKGEFLKVADRANWRGPDHSGYSEGAGGAIKFAHNRLAVIDVSVASNQPLTSSCGRYTLVYNGEIYNYKELECSLDLECKSNSDSIFLLRAFEKCGQSIVSMLEGMFAFVVYDAHNNSFFAARDQLGIKPLFFYNGSRGLYFGSEASLVAELCGATHDFESYCEWELFRRPVPGNSYFAGVQELLPGHYYNSYDAGPRRYWTLCEQDTSSFSQDHFEALLAESVHSHCMSDVPVVSMLSGGIDSAVITKLSGVNNSYTVGLVDNNEFAGALDSANEIGCSVRTVKVEDGELVDIWMALTRLRGEPLSVPNEGLIYSLCRTLDPKEKVILTGEGADELLFGYDKIFRWGFTASFDPMEFLSLYSYGHSGEQPRLYRFWSFIDDLRSGKTNIEFLEDFFIHFHLPGLLRRMDFASMAASKEARVPFVSVRLFEYLYRRPYQLKILGSRSKIPIRIAARNLGLTSCLDKPKVGFSASLGNNIPRIEEYKKFQSIIKKELSWS